LKEQSGLDESLAIKYLDVKIMSKRKLESLTNGTGVHVFLVMWKALHAVEAYAQRSVAELEMCGSDFAVLEALLHKGPLPINELGKKVLLTSGSITVAVDRLESKGLVERRTSGTDRRARIVHLTKAGKELIARLYASASLTKAERETLIRLLKKIGYEAAGKFREE
jgi:MarR family 2-MHQ and catechol resistance regulon transcriptional repressor